MQEPILSFYIVDEDNFQIPDVSIKEFRLYSSIFSSFPGAELTIDDPEGKFLAAVAVKPGNLIMIPCAPGEVNGVQTSTDAVISLGPFRVMGVNNPGSQKSENEQTQLGSLGGDYKIQMAHPWAMQSDYTNHAYKKKLSDLVKDMATNDARGFTFPTITVDPSDDAGTIIRYKIAESEAHFIHQKILPYATIDKQAAYSFVDELGNFHFRSFARMYAQDPKLVILPPYTDAASTLYDPKSKLTQLYVYDGGWWIGRKFLDQLGNFKKKVYVENPHPDVNLTFVATTPYQSSIPGYTLMKKEFIDSIVGGTDGSIFPFRSFEDILGLNANNNSSMNEYFQVATTVDFAADLATVGTTVQLKLAGIDPEKDHWMNGKWLVVATEHFLKEGRYFSKYLLSRPAIDKLPENIDSASMYNINAPKKSAGGKNATAV